MTEIHFRFKTDDILQHIVETHPELMEDTVEDNHIDSRSRIVLYYADWCCWSKLFMPEWNEFEEICKTEFPNLSVEKIESESIINNDEIMKIVLGYPAVVYYSNDGSYSKFESSRTVEALIDFVQEQ